MRWWFSKHDRMEAGRRARLIHSLWLTEAMARPYDVPRIPTRRVSEGGFASMASRPGGMARAERWWSLALERTPLE
ncbi:MAG: hypothetical protein R3B68_07105 [Phycisphaerales bacterium]